MKSLPKPLFARVQSIKQRGVVLFFALVAMLAMSLAAVALIRSVDTSTIIAGNLAFKRAATSSSDAGVEAAITWLAATDTANNVLNALTDPTHPFNNTGGVVNALGTFQNNGYYSNANSTVSLTDGTGIQWDNNDSTLVGTDAGGNTTRYVIQRMCLTANVTVQLNQCLFSGAIQDNNGKNIPLPQDVCDGPGCPVAGQTPQIRITAKTEGPRNTVSYVQVFVY